MAILNAKLDHFLSAVRQSSAPVEDQLEPPSQDAMTVDGDIITVDGPLIPPVTSWSLHPEDPHEPLQSQVPLRSLCSQCFGDNPKAEVGFVTFDGNFQHKRFPTSKNGDDRYREYQDRRLFIDNEFENCDDVQYCPLCFTNCGKTEINDDSATTCGNNFTAAAEKVVSNRVADSGLMAAVCRCGIPLRLYNIRQTGERAIYVVRLLQSVMRDESCPPKLMLLYDINCKFSKFVKVVFRVPYIFLTTRINLNRRNSLD
jgi:hypothetical protein